MLTDDTQRLEQKIDQLMLDQRARLKTRNRRDLITLGVMVVAFGSLAVMLLLDHNTFAALYQLSFLFWAGWSTMLNIEINQQDYIINVQHGLHQIESEEIQQLMAEAPKKERRARANA